MNNELEEVPEAEWRAFIASYPRQLERDVFAAADPAYVSFNDFKHAPKWPESVVASCLFRRENTDPLYNPPFRILRAAARGERSNPPPESPL